MKNFLKREDGYVLALTLIALPAFVGLGLIVMDINRGNNAHSDLQAAADALALAAGRELDGSPDSIDRAKAAMANLTNSVAYLDTEQASQANLVYADADGNEFTVIFLDDLPASDDTALTETFLTDHAVTDGEDALFVYVRAQADDLSAFFFNPATGLRPTVPIAADAVATYRTAACDVTPLYICNPFETQNLDLQDAFAAGHLYGRLLKLHPKGSDTASPGNFGFLSVRGANDNTSASANAIREIFAGAVNPTCYDARTVTTKPGAATSIAQGINVRFDIYDGPFGNRVSQYPPAENVRKGYVRGSGNACNSEPYPDTLNNNQTLPPPEDWWAIGFPENATMAPPGQGALGAFIGSGDWDINLYWSVNFPSVPLTQTMLDEMNSMPLATFPGSTVPSRYDVYRYEIDNNLLDVRSQGDGGNNNNRKETGRPICALSKNPPVNGLADPDRRIVFAALIDCIANEDEGGGINRYPVNAYASLFLVNPMDETIDVEIIDITGAGGNGTLDTFVRDEAILVR
ncbi:hypothetical protein E7811_15550 [Aliigemmobacter aestuarii]|uniref:Putative Flp pilus-assembly TadG-like N-terminal domain-containing protein n=1 Tax=Aliigemmobacter aestuarii TaxID=1445661 RepID=A0A4S3MKT6_9RHOB|nr:pilus assembly protein TadG-related protein [Gemmobacter aestuarii]THD82455.1 hypothetical protein E7811_15550 [Gemmobacter aestuarii]